MYAQLRGQPTLYWLHSLVLTVIGSFGGGFIAPVLLGKPALVFNNDLIMLCSIACWYFVHYLSGHHLLNWKPVKMIWSCFLGIFRTGAVINIVVMAHNTLTPSKYYPIPLFGPILSGTLLGSMGAFLPFDKGLAAISKNTPWAIQAAFLSAVIYHLMIHDTHGLFGVSLRLMLGTYSRSTITVLIAIMQIAHLELQLFLSPEANMFTPLHKLGYLLFQVEGPKLPSQQVPSATLNVGWNLKTRNRLKWLLDLSRVLIVLLVFTGHIFLMVLPVSLPAVPTSTFPTALTMQPTLQNATVSLKQYEELRRHALPLNSSIGRCQWFQPWRQCQPVMMKLEQLLANNADTGTYRLAVYEHMVNKILYEAAVAHLTPIYASSPVTVNKLKTTIPAGYHADPSLVLHTQGILYLIWMPKLPIIHEQTQFNVWFYPMAQVIPSAAKDEEYCGQVLPTLNNQANSMGLSAPLQYITVTADHTAVVGVCQKSTAEEGKAEL